MSAKLTVPLRCALVLAGCLGGCASTSASYTPLNPSPRELKGRTPAQVEIFSSGPPDRPHVDVGLISVEQGDGDETPAGLIDILRGVAAEKGCDALMLAPPGSNTREDWLGTFRGYQVYSGTCLVYGIAEPRDVPSAPPANQRRMCRDRRDFDETRNCVLAAPAR